MELQNYISIIVSISGSNFGVTSKTLAHSGSRKYMYFFGMIKL